MTAVLEELTAQLEYFDCFIAFNSRSHPGLTRITIQVIGSSRSVMLTRFQP